jgi:hypothetical protein
MKYTDAERAVHTGMATGNPDMPYSDAVRYFPTMPESTWKMLRDVYGSVFREFPELMWGHVQQGMDVSTLRRRAAELRGAGG